MRQHVDKVHHQHVEVVLFQFAKLAQQSFGSMRVVDFVVREAATASVALKHSIDQRRLVEVLAFLRFFIYPKVGEEFLYVQRHESGEYCVAGILGCGGEYRCVQLFLDIEYIGKEWFYTAPLVEAEVVDKDKEELVAVVEQRKYFFGKNLRRHQRMFVGAHPVFVVALYPLCKLAVGLGFLHFKQLVHVGFCGCQLEFAVNQTAVQLVPLLNSIGRVNALRQGVKFLAVIAGGLLRHKAVGVQYLFDCNQYLIGVHRLYKVVGDFVSYGLIHDVFLLALGNHYHRQQRKLLLYQRQGFKTGQAGHILVEHNKVERLRLDQFERIAAIVGGCDLITSVTQKHQVGFEQVDFIVSPQYMIVLAHYYGQLNSKSSSSSPSEPGAYCGALGFSCLLVCGCCSGPESGIRGSDTG